MKEEKIEARTTGFSIKESFQGNNLNEKIECWREKKLKEADFIVEKYCFRY